MLCYVAVTVLWSVYTSFLYTMGLIQRELEYVTRPSLSQIRMWAVKAEHLAERCLFIP
jgi:hypothetical protein